MWLLGRGTSFKRLKAKWRFQILNKTFIGLQRGCRLREDPWASTRGFHDGWEDKIHLPRGRWLRKVTRASTKRLTDAEDYTRKLLNMKGLEGGERCFLILLNTSDQNKKLWRLVKFMICAQGLDDEARLVTTIGIQSTSREWGEARLIFKCLKFEMMKLLLLSGSK